MEYKKKFRELDNIMDLIEKNNDIDKQLELYEKGKKKCNSLEKNINIQKNNIEKLEDDFIKGNIDFQEEGTEDIKKILNELEEIYKKINSDEIPVDELEKFYKQSLILKKKSQEFCKKKDLKIEYL